MNIKEPFLSWITSSIKKAQYWGYHHINDTYMIKLYYGPMEMEEAEKSLYVAAVAGPVWAKDRQDAIDQIVCLLRKKQGLY